MHGTTSVPNKEASWKFLPYTVRLNEPSRTCIECEIISRQNDKDERRRLNASLSTIINEIAATASSRSWIYEAIALAAWLPRRLLRCLVFFDTVLHPSSSKFVALFGSDFGPDFGSNFGSFFVSLPRQAPFA
jgi:hypothetical protein